MAVGDQDPDLPDDLLVDAGAADGLEARPVDIGTAPRSSAACPLSGWIRREPARRERRRRAHARPITMTRRASVPGPRAWTTPVGWPPSHPWTTRSPRIISPATHPRMAAPTSTIHQKRAMSRARSPLPQITRGIDSPTPNTTSSHVAVRRARDRQDVVEAHDHVGHDDDPDRLEERRALSDVSCSPSPCPSCERSLTAIHSRTAPPAAWRSGIRRRTLMIAMKTIRRPTAPTVPRPPRRWRDGHPGLNAAREILSQRPLRALGRPAREDPQIDPAGWRHPRDALTRRAWTSDQVSTGRSGSEPSQPSAPPLTIAKKPRRPSLSTWISMSWPRTAEASWRVVSTSPN